MRVLFVLHDFLETNVAGTELHTYYLAKYLQKTTEVHLFYNLEDRQQPLGVSHDYYEDLTVTRVNYPATSFNDYAPRDHRHLISQAFEDLLQKFKPDVVHFQHILHLAPELVSIAAQQNIPVVYTLHDFWLLCHQIKMLRKDHRLCRNNGALKCAQCHFENLDQPLTSLFPVTSGLKMLYWRMIEEYRVFRYFSRDRFQETRAIFEAVDLFVSPSRFLRDIFIENGLPKEKITVVENGIPTINIWPRSPSSHLRFGYIGGLNVEKGLHILLQAFASIDNAELRIYGVIDNNFARHLADSVNNLNIHFCGPVTGTEKEQALSDLDVMIVPSIWYENAPLSILESYKVGCPVIASNIGGMAEFVIDGITGLLFKNGDANDLKIKLNNLIDNPSLINEFRNNLPQVRSVEDNARDIKSIYDMLLANINSAPELNYHA